MNYRTFIVWLLLSLPVQLDKLGKQTALGSIEVLNAFLTASLIALSLTFVARWIRIKFAPNLTESYIAKIQGVFAVIGLLLTINVLINPKGNQEVKKLSMLDEASLVADLVISLQADCKSITSNSNGLCESLSEKVTECIGGSRKPKDELISTLVICREKISKEFGK